VEHSTPGEDPLLQQVRFRKICLENRLIPDEAQFNLLGEFVDILLEWNKKVNLISRADTANIWLSHILHSVSPLFSVAIPPGKRILDLGSGGGLPGVPISILRRDLQLVHIDSIQKKIVALRDIISRLGLANEVIGGRAEELGRRPELIRMFDVVIARAVAPLDELIRWSRPFLKREPFADEGAHERHGLVGLTRPSLLAMKGGDLEDEIKKAKIKAGVKDVRVIDLRLGHDPESGITGKKLLLVPL
jgi:16S rRNA (guanine527-N7)-methyltransferase